MTSTSKSLLPAKWRQVQVAEVATEVFDAASVTEIGLIDIVAVAQKDAYAKRLAFVRGHAKVTVKIGAEWGLPRNGPAHALLERLDLVQWSTGNQDP